MAIALFMQLLGAASVACGWFKENAFLRFAGTVVLLIAGEYGGGGVCSFHSPSAPLARRPCSRGWRGKFNLALKLHPCLLTTVNKWAPVTLPSSSFVRG